jgi:hypothetical protein
MRTGASLGEMAWMMIKATGQTKQASTKSGT